MADTTTPNYAFVKPEVGASNDSWGTKLNADLVMIDALIKTATDTAVGALPKAGGTMTGQLIVNVAGAGISMTDAQFPRLDFVRTAVATWHVGGSGTAGDNSFNIWLNNLAPVVSIDTGNQTVATSGAIKATGGVSSAGRVRAVGTSLVGLSNAAGAEIMYDGANGILQASDPSGGGIYKPLLLVGTNVSLAPQGGGIYSGGNHAVQGILSLGGATLGGINGQVQFNGSAGGANLANLTMITATELRLSNTTAGSFTTYINGLLQQTISGSGVFTRTLVRSGPAGAGAVQIAPGAGGLTGYLEFLDTAGSSVGYIQQTIAGPITYMNSTAGGHTFQGGLVTAPSLAVSGGTTMTTLTASGVVRAGSIGANGAITLTPGASGVLSGSLDFRSAANNLIGYIQQTSPAGTINYVNGAGAGHAFTGGGLSVSSLAASGVVEGTSPGGTTGGLRSRGIAGGAPAYIQLTNNNASAEWGHIRADGAKIYISVNGSDVASIDAAGNMRVLGTVTQSVAP